MYRKQFSAFAIFHDHNPFPFPSSRDQFFPIHTLENHKVEILVLEQEAPDTVEAEISVLEQEVLDTVEVEFLVLVAEVLDTAEGDNSPCTVLSAILLVLLEGVDLAHGPLVVVQFEEDASPFCPAQKADPVRNAVLPHTDNNPVRPEDSTHRPVMGDTVYL